MFSLQTFLATVLLVSTTLALPITTAPVEARDVIINCNSNLRIFTVRGSNTPHRDNGLFDFGNGLASFLTNSIAHDLPYPATLDDYSASESEGVEHLTFRVKRYIDHCPTGKVALIGYSQGAHVVGDTLIGPTGTTGLGLEPQYRDNIVAVVQMGDPAFEPGLSFDAGTSTTPGVCGRTNAAQYTSYGYADKMRSYCDNNDEYCASGSSLAVHESYMTDYTNDMWNFIVSKA